MTGSTNVLDESAFPGLLNGGQGGVFPDGLLARELAGVVNVDEVEGVGLELFEGFVNLSKSAVFGLGLYFAHQKNFFAAFADDLAETGLDRKSVV